MKNAVALAVRRDGPIVVVVSALARVTDALLEAAAAVGRNAGRIEEIAADLAHRHRAAIRAVVPAGASRQQLLAAADRAFDELALLSRAPVFVRDLSAGVQDALLSRGEEMSARIFAAGLTAAGRPAVFVDPLGLIATDGRFGGASPRLAETDRNIRRILGPISEEGRRAGRGGVLRRGAGRAGRHARARRLGPDGDAPGARPLGAGGLPLEGRAGNPHGRPPRRARRPRRPAAEHPRGGGAGVLRRQGPPAARAHPGRPARHPGLREALRAAGPARHGGLAAKHAEALPGQGAVGDLRPGAPDRDRQRDARRAGHRRAHVRRAPP